MKVFFYPIYNETPHLETELEIISNHLEAGDEVVVMKCRGELKTCFYNPFHKKLLCKICQSRLNSGLNLLKKPVKIINYPQISIDYNRIPATFANIEALKSFELDGVSVGLAAASSLISRINREHKLDTLTYVEDGYKEVCNSYYLAQVFQQYVFPNVKPDLVYIFNGRIATTAPIVDVCRNNNISFFTHERGGQKGRYWLVKDTIPHDVQNVYSEIENIWHHTDQSKRAELGRKFFIDRRNRVEQGWFSFTKEQKEKLLPEGFNKEKKNIVFFNSTIEEFAAVKGWQKPLFLFTDEINALTTILEKFKDDYSKKFYLRVHPNLRGFDNSQTKDLYKLSSRFGNLEIILPESPIDTYSLIDNCDQVVTFGSTVGIEANYWNKPSIQLGIAFYNNLEAVYIPKSVDDLFNLINADLKPLQTELSLKYGLWELMRGEQYKYVEQIDLKRAYFNGKEITPSGSLKLIQAIYCKLYNLKQNFLGNKK